MSDIYAQLPPAEEHIIKNLDDEYCVGYDGITDTNWSKKDLEPAIKTLKDLGYIQFYRGLMTEDDNMNSGVRFGGSGWSLTTKGEEYKIQYRLHHD